MGVVFVFGSHFVMAAAFPSVPLRDLRMPSGRGVTQLNANEMRAAIHSRAGDASGNKAAYSHYHSAQSLKKLLHETSAGAQISGLTVPQLAHGVSLLGESL